LNLRVGAPPRATLGTGLSPRLAARMATGTELGTSGRLLKRAAKRQRLAMPPRPRCQSRPKPAGAAWRWHAGCQWPHAAPLRPRLGGGRCRVPGWPGAWSARQARLPLRALATFLVPTEVHNGTSCMLAPRGPVHTQPKRRPLFCDAGPMSGGHLGRTPTRVPACGQHVRIRNRLSCRAYVIACRFRTRYTWQYVSSQ
jgi:hypothetical protein